MLELQSETATAFIKLTIHSIDHIRPQHHMSNREGSGHPARCRPAGVTTGLINASESATIPAYMGEQVVHLHIEEYIAQTALNQGGLT